MRYNEKKHIGGIPMRVYNLIFSPTGGTEKVMDILAAEFGSPATIDLCAPVNPMELTPGDVALIGLPSYGGRIPGIAGERLRRIRGNGAKAVLVAVYGNRAIDDTLIEMKDLAEECGFRVVAAISAVAEHSIMRHVAKGRPDAEDAVQLQDFARHILAKPDTAPEVAVPGKRPYKNFGGAGMFPEVEGCTSCGLCADRCPAGAIPADAPDTTDKTKCICCMRCIEICPAGARRRSETALQNTIERLKNAVSGRKPNELYL